MTPPQSHPRVTILRDEVGLTGYKDIPLKTYQTAVSFLNNWLLALTQAGKDGT